MTLGTRAGQQVSLAAEELSKQWGTFRPKAGIVLGSGLGAVADALQVEGQVSYAALYGFPQSTVAGHDGCLTYGTWAGAQAVCLRGRAHLYEGHAPEAVVLPVRTLIQLGAEYIIVTNAAGGIRPDLGVGSLMMITDHLNLTGTSPLLGMNEPSWGPRFPDMSAAYSPELRTLARQVANDAQIALGEGVYAGVLGPSYETPAEVEMLGRLGADAVGMSTVLEVMAARHMGAQVMGISCIANPAAGLGDGPLDHTDVAAAARTAETQLAKLIHGLLQRLAAE